jgi:hypothetical protein
LSLRAAAGQLPRAFWMFAASAGLATAGLVTFGVISYHLVTGGLVSTAAVPLVYAAAMAAEADPAVRPGFPAAASPAGRAAGPAGR